ncbi:MAG: extracellular solute-binding protein [Planctomycetota bacterium]|nr:extracellular solute-binding protein [Planctomycetota bacterium]
MVKPAVFGSILSCLVVVSFSTSSLSCKSKSNETRRQVVLYCSVDQAVSEPVIAEFQKQTGIKVLARYDTEAGKTVGLIQRLRAEKDSPSADVFWSNEIFYTIRLGREGLLTTSRSGAQWPSHLTGRQGQWYGFALRARVIGYSTQRVPAADAPKSLEDLLDKKWKGRIVMADPRFGTTGGDVAGWFAHYGADRAAEILGALKANKVRLVPGNSIAVRMVATGQADVCMTDTDDVYAAQRNGWPVAMNWLDQGGAGVLTIPNTVAIIKGCPNPDEAEALLKFLLSEQVERMLARSDSHNTPVHPSVAAEFNRYAIPKPLEIDYEKVADELPTAVRRAWEAFR